MTQISSTGLAKIASPLITGLPRSSVPSLIDGTGVAATKRFIEFFVVTIRNWNTRDAYYRACSRFLHWCEHQRLKTVLEIQPIHVAAYIELMGFDFEKSTVKQHLAAIRMMFDWLVIGQVVPVNPATSVRGPKHDVLRGTTPVLTATDARKLLDQIDTTKIVGMRDRALISLMLFSFARITAALTMLVDDYFVANNNSWVRLQEKGGKRHEMPAHHQLQSAINTYIRAAKIGSEEGAPLFRANRDDDLLERAMTRTDAYRMIRRRAYDVGIYDKISCHSFRATGITIYLSNGGTLENAQKMAGHKSPRTTKLYDRTNDEVARAEVERIAI